MKRSPLARRTPLRSSRTPLATVGKAKARKRKRYAAHLRSPYFKALRLERFALDGWRCTGSVHVMRQTPGVKWPASETEYMERCTFVDETHTGKGLQGHHTSYARFGKERLSDIRTMCRDHHHAHHAADWWKVRP